MERNAAAGYALGDLGYPLRPWLMTPFRNPGTPAERNYNTSHKKTRVVEEQVIGRWKRRFHLLHVKNRRMLEHVNSDIASCAVLHNIAVSQGQPDVFNDEAYNDPQPPAALGVDANDAVSGTLRRRRIANQFFAVP